MERGASYTDFHPDRVAMQDATAQMALLQFMTAGLPEVAVPTTVHCDHLIQAKVGAADRPRRRRRHQRARSTTSCRACRPSTGSASGARAAGIIHQVVLENYAFPGGMMIGTDSHTPNAGGLGMVAIGVGGADAVDVMTGFPFNVRCPKVIGVHLTGELSGWTRAEGRHPRGRPASSPSKGGTGAIVEYFGPGADSISATGKATICNMGAEIGATTSVFGYDANMAAYLKATGREAIADAADRRGRRPAARPRGRRRRDFYDQVIEIDLDRAGAADQRPALPRPAPTGSVPRSAPRRVSNDWPLEISPRSSARAPTRRYEDITRAASIARQATAKGLKAKTEAARSRPAPSRSGPPSSATACSPTSRRSAATVLANACGPCIGQWARPDMDHRARRTRSSTRTTATSRSATTARPTR